MINYYGKFLSNLASNLSIHSCRRSGRYWFWGQDQQRAFDAARAQLIEATLLIHYSLKEELVLACDVSAYGVGAVLSHRMADG